MTVDPFRSYGINATGVARSDKMGCGWALVHMLFDVLVSYPTRLLIMAWGLRVLWSWYLVPLGLPTLSLGWAAGLVLVAFSIKGGWVPKQVPRAGKSMGYERQPDWGLLGWLLYSVGKVLVVGVAVLWAVLVGYLIHAYVLGGVTQ